MRFNVNGGASGSGDDTGNWEKIYTETLTEEIASFTYALPDSCYGALVCITAPKEQTVGGASLFTTAKNGERAASIWSGAASTSNYIKYYMMEVIPEHGYYKSRFVACAGTTESPAFMTRPGYTNAVESSIALDSVTFSGRLPIGAEIKVWGLIGK